MPLVQAAPATRTPTPDRNLRPHQVEAFRAIFEHLHRGIHSQLCMLPTGAGKTYLAIAIAQHFKRTLFIVPRQELLKQTRDSYATLNNGREAGIIWRNHVDTDAPFTVTVVNSLHRRLEQFDPDAFDLIIIDEAHHVLAKQWREATEHFHPRLLLGLSATPERLDGAPLNAIFSTMSYSMGVKDAVQAGILVRPRAMQIHTDIDLGDVKKVAGKFDEGELNRLVNTEERNRIVLNTYRKHAENRPAVAFTAGIDHARDLAELFNRNGIPAESVAGTDTDREGRIGRFERGEVKLLANASLLVEGWDYPPVSCVLMTRPTESRALYVQSVGRGLRLAPNKTDCLIIDFHDSSRNHRLAGIWDFWGAKRKNKRKLEEPTDLLEQDEQHEERLDSLAGAWNIRTYTEMIDLLEPPPDIDEFVLGAHTWHTKPASEKQLATLERLGYDTTLDWTRGQASAVIGKEPPTKAQLKLLLALGFDTLGFQWSRAEATKAITDAKAAGKEPDWSVFPKLMRNQAAHRA